MEINERLVDLEKQIGERIDDFNHKRKRDKKIAFSLKILTVVLSAMISVLLGVKVSTFFSEIFKNISLVLGSLITVVTAIDAFYNHRSLWIQRTITITQLYALQRDITNHKLGQPKPPEKNEELIDTFHERLDKILDNEVKSWLKLRDEPQS